VLVGFFGQRDDLVGWSRAEIANAFKEPRPHRIPGCGRARRARSDGPQYIGIRGRDAVVVIFIEEWERLTPRQAPVPFLEFMRNLDLAGLDLEREIDHGRDCQLGLDGGWTPMSSPN
jgi:hypothetical protein